MRATLLSRPLSSRPPVPAAYVRRSRAGGAGLRRAGPLLLAVVAALALLACGKKTGDIRGHLASAESGAMTRALVAAGHADAKDGVRTLDQAISLEGIEVELLRVGDGDDPDGWTVVRRTEPAPDGSFAFPDVEEGRYALRLLQPEFGGAAYGVDATDFELRDGQTVRLVLPLVSHLHVEAPGTGLSVSAPPVLEAETGRVFGVSSTGLWALDPIGGAIQVLYSDQLFADTVVYSMKVPILVSARGELVVLLSDRLVAVDLDVFAEAGSRVIDYDDPAVRVALGDSVRWRMLPEDADAAVQEGQYLGSWPSADGNTLYVSLSSNPGWDPRDIVPGTGRTLVLDLENLAVRRVIRGEARAYHPLTDQLVFHGPEGVLLVDASAIRDVGSAPLQADLGVAPVPGREEFMVAWTQLSAQDQLVPFLARIDSQANVLWEERASTLFGLRSDPQPGAPAFDTTGTYFMLGAQGYRVLADDTWEEVGVQVPPGRAFQERVACNRRQLFDPVHRYEIRYDCGDDPDGLAAMAILSADRGNIPISLRINGSHVVVDAARGRVMVFVGATASIIHYADPTATETEERRTLEAGQDIRPQGPPCSDTEPCPGEDICVGATDTAFSGHCSPNRRNPWLVRCGGLTRVACDPGFTCTHDNPTNPESPGFCDGFPNRDHVNAGLPCADGACELGMTCHTDTDRCVPMGCLADDDCADGLVCGMVPQLGMVCLPPGPLADGALCTDHTDCAGGTCVPIRFTPWWDDPLREVGMQVCATPCLANRDCAEGQDCAVFHVPWPICVDRDGPLGTRNAALCTAECGPEQICRGTECSTGLWLPWFHGPGDPNLGSCSMDHECPAPSRCIPDSMDHNRCGFACQRNRDCPWDTECFQGECVVQGSHYTERPEPFICHEGLGCDPHEQCIEVWFFSEEWPLYCVDADPCRSDAECADGENCVGICSADCHPADGASADACPPGWQCVHRDLGDGWSPHTCLPSACDCPPHRRPERLLRRLPHTHLHPPPALRPRRLRRHLRSRPPRRRHLLRPGQPLRPQRRRDLPVPALVRLVDPRPLRGALRRHAPDRRRPAVPRRLELHGAAQSALRVAVHGGGVGAVARLPGPAPPQGEGERGGIAPRRPAVRGCSA